MINQVAARQHRKELINYLKKSFSEYFASKDLQKECEIIQKKAEEIADMLEQEYIT